MNRRGFFGRLVSAFVVGYFGKWRWFDRAFATFAPSVPRLGSLDLANAVTMSGPFQPIDEPDSLVKAMLIVDMQRYDGTWEHAFIGGTELASDDADLMLWKHRNLRESLVWTVHEACDRGYRELNSQKIPFKAIRMFNNRVAA